MQDAAFTQVIDQIVRGELSVNAAAKALGMPNSTLRERLSTNPDYVRAKVEGKLRAAPDTTPVNVEDLRKNAAVLAVVNDGMSLRKAIAAFPDAVSNPQKLGRWVKIAYPDHEIGTDMVKRKSVEEYAQKEVQQLLAELKMAAMRLNVAPEKMLKFLANGLERDSRP